MFASFIFKPPGAAALMTPLHFSSVELTAQDCLFMGKHAFNAGAYARAVEWFEESYILAGQENNRTLRQDQVMEFIQHAINMVKTYRFYSIPF